MMIRFPWRSFAKRALMWASATSLTSTDGTHMAGIPGMLRLTILAMPSGVLTRSVMIVGPITIVGWRVTISRLPCLLSLIKSRIILS